MLDVLTAKKVTEEKDLVVEKEVHPSSDEDGVVSENVLSALVDSPLTFDSE